MFLRARTITLSQVMRQSANVIQDCLAACVQNVYLGRSTLCLGLSKSTACVQDFADRGGVKDQIVFLRDCTITLSQVMRQSANVIQECSAACVQDVADRAHQVTAEDGYQQPPLITGVPRS